MAMFEGKTQAEKNKLIAAVVLGLIALVTLYFAFGRSLFGSSTTAKTSTSPTPKPSITRQVKSGDNVMPTTDEQDFVNQTTAIDYRPGSSGAPVAGRNIFAFYEPPAPTPYSPTPYVAPVVKTPTPPPPPPLLVAFTNPQSVYAGSQGFRLEVNGDKFTPDTRVYVNQVEMPTIFVNTQKLVADVPSSMIAQETQMQVIAQTADGKYSNPAMVAVQAPPRPGFQYIGMIGRKRFNNDTAYFTEQSKDAKPFGARLNDVVGGRFRLIDISSAEVVFQDVELGFRHRLALTRSATAGGGTGAPARAGAPEGIMPGNPTIITPGNCPPGIPCNELRPYVPPTQPKRTPTDKKDVDDDDDGDGY